MRWNIMSEEYGKETHKFLESISFYLWPKKHTSFWSQSLSICDPKIHLGFWNSYSMKFYASRYYLDTCSVFDQPGRKFQHAQGVTVAT